MRIRIACSRCHAEMAIFALRRGKRNRLVRADVHGGGWFVWSRVYKDIQAADDVGSNVVDIHDGAHANPNGSSL